MAVKIFNLSRFVYQSSLSSLKVSSLSLPDTEILRKKYLNLWTPYLTTGSRIYQNKIYSLETLIMFTICVKLKSKTLFISEIYGSENEIMKVFF